MTVHPLNPIVIKKQTIHWRVVSGRVIGIQKYTKTHVVGSGDDVSSWIEIIIELSIQHDNGNEIQMILKKPETPVDPFIEGMGEIQVRERQYVSGVLGYNKDKSSDWLFFVNHDEREWYWVVNPLIFLESMGISPVPLWWNVLFCGVILFAVLTFNSSYIGSTFLMGLRSFEFGVLVVSILICLYMLQIYLIRSLLEIIRPQIAEIARQLIRG